MSAPYAPPARPLAPPYCERCDKHVPALHDACQDHFDEDLCPGCYDDRCEAAWMSQQERLMSEPPMSLAEQQRRAFNEKHGRTFL